MKQQPTAETTIQVVEQLQEGFGKGCDEVKLKDQQALRADLMKALQLKPTSVQSFINLRNGSKPIMLSRVIAVLQVFQRYGIEQPFGKSQRTK